MSTELSQDTQPSLLVDLASAVGMDPKKYYATIKSMCGCDGANDESFAALLMQARKLDLDPVARQLFLIRTQGGVQVVIPVDGYLRMMIRHPDYVSHTVSDVNHPDGRPISKTITIYTKEQVAANLPPFQHTEYYAECVGNSRPWKSHPHRMLRHKCVSQGVRNRFAIYLPDPDEYERADEIATGALPQKASGLSGLTQSLQSRALPSSSAAEAVRVDADVHDDDDLPEYVTPGLDEPPWQD